MKIEHLAIWCKDLAIMSEFYMKYFQATRNEKYHNQTKGFESYFLTFAEGARLELMKMANIPNSSNDIYQQAIGLTHFAISVGSEEAVNQLTEQLRHDGFEIVGEPRRTGDGYYESVVFDPENNRIEITG